MTNDKPVCAVLTPPGRGAIATVAVRGPGAALAVARRFTPKGGQSLENFGVGRIAFGRFRTATGTEEELVVGLIEQDAIEVHCHGGSAAIAAICDALVAAGCRLIESAEWAAEKPADPLATAALLARCCARTERTAAILLDQHRGALRSAVATIERHLNDGNGPDASAALAELVARGDFGLHLTQPWKVVLAGRPNAGKSSVLNAIVGYERAIVFEQPGTTRDVLTASTAIEGWPVELADTAGLRIAEGEIEVEGIERARREISGADAVMLIVDTTAAWDAELFAKVAEQASRLLIVHNKCDLHPPPNDGRPAGVEVSAQTGAGIETLCTALGTLLVPDPPLPGEAVPFTREQLESLRAAAAHLERGGVPAAQEALQPFVCPPAGYDADSCLPR